MSKILRFNLSKDRNHALPGSPIMMPPDSTTISGAMMPDGLSIWALCPHPSLEATEPHYFTTIPTGKDIPDWIADCRFVGTLQYHNLSQPGKVKVDHLFELSEQDAKALSLAANIAG